MQEKSINEDINIEQFFGENPEVFYKYKQRIGELHNFNCYELEVIKFLGYIEKQDQNSNLAKNLKAETHSQLQYILEKYREGLKNKLMSLLRIYEITSKDSALAKVQMGNEIFSSFKNIFLYGQYGPTIEKLAFLWSDLDHFLRIDESIEYILPDLHFPLYLYWGLPKLSSLPNQLSFLDFVSSKSDQNLCKFVFVESGPLFSSTLEENSSGLSFVLDDRAHYFDASEATRLEDILNNAVYEECDLIQSKKFIGKIIENCISKYNHQEISDIRIGSENTKKVLVIDQTFGDQSINKGLASRKTFEYMLKRAIEDNPGAEIIIKTHPDQLGGYFDEYDFHNMNNVHVVDYSLNSISLIKFVDKVYVCSSHVGFEALMCKKETHVFGIPWYSGWGITIDYQTLARRKQSRTLEELFYAFYLQYVYYVDPKTRKKSDLESTLNYILKTRKLGAESYRNNDPLEIYLDESKKSLKTIIKDSKKTLRIAIWGANKFSRDIIDFHKKSKFFEITAWVDSQYYSKKIDKILLSSLNQEKKMNEKILTFNNKSNDFDTTYRNLNLDPVEKLLEIDFDYLLIASESSKQEIKDSCKNMFKELNKKMNFSVLMM